MTQHIDEINTIDENHAGEEALAAYAMGVSSLDKPVMQHIEQCDTCQGEVTQLRAMLHVMDGQLYRLDCLTVEEIGEYALDMSSSEDRALIEAHMQECPRCAHELETSRAFLQPIAQELEQWSVVQQGLAQNPSHAAGPALAGVVEGLRRIVASLMPAPPTLNPAFNLKGIDDEDDTLRTYTAEDIEVTVRHESVRANRILYGAIRTVTPGQSAEASVVELFPAGEGDAITPPAVAHAPIARTQVKLGTFRLPPVPPGTYQLNLLFPDRVIVVDQIDLH